MRTWICLGLVALVLLGCDSSTEPELPKLKTGANAELAIELPLVFPPEPRQAQILTEWSVIQNEEIWFRNVTKDPIDLSMWVTEERTGDTDRVGIYRLAGFTNKPMALDKQFTTSEYRDHEWTMLYTQGNVRKTIVVGFAD